MKILNRFCITTLYEYLVINVCAYRKMYGINLILIINRTITESLVFYICYQLNY